MSATLESPRALGARQRTLVALAALVLVWAFAPFVLVAVGAAVHHRTFLGVAGYYPMDGLQYLGWVRDAHDGLIRNLYGSSAGKAVFVHPMYSLSGLVQGVVGLSPIVMMGFWKAVSVVVLFAGCLKAATRYVQRPRRTLALLLALFGGLTPLAAVLPLIDHGQAGADFARAAGDLVAAMSTWDYAPLAIALGLMPFVIEGQERVLAGERRAVWGAAALGLLVAWLHPWQGITLIVVGAGLALAHASGRRRELRDGIAALLPALVATAVPVLYYLLLSRIDGGWATSEQNSVGGAFIPLPVAGAGEAPLILIALLAALRCRRDPGARALLLWPLATMLTIAVSPSGQYRALDGLAIPVALLAVRVWPERAPRFATIAAILAAVAPVAVFGVGAFVHLQRSQVTAYTELSPSDVQAVRVGARAAGGGPLLAPAALGTAIPALADVPSWVGHPIWTPDYGVRKQRAASLFAGVLPRTQVRALIDEVRPRALVEPCPARADLHAALTPLGYVETRMGCARVYTRAH